MAQLKFDDLWRNHPTNLSNQLPCRLKDGSPTWANQCAVRLGVSMREAGIKPTQLSGLVSCGAHPYSDMHFIRAQQVADRLASRAGSIEGLGVVQRLKGDDAANYANTLYGKRGLIFIKDYWTRHGESGKSPSGDHIDVWNGYRTSARWFMEYFSWLGYYGGYEKAREVWFWPVEG